MRERSVSGWIWLGGLAAALVGCHQQPKQLLVDPTRAYVDARAVLLQAAEDSDPQVRTNALEALAATEGHAAGAVYLQSLRDERLPVVSAGAMAIGETRYAPALATLRTLATEPRTPAKLKCVTLYALHRLGDDRHTGELAALLRDRDKFVRAEAARVMGKMGEPSAKGPLKALQRDDLEVVVRLNVAEALAALGDERSVGLLEAFTKSQFLEDRLIAVAALGRLRRARSVYALKRLLRDDKQDPLVRVAAAGSLGRLREPDGQDLALDALRDPEGVLRKARGANRAVRQHEITSLQTLAALAQENFGEKLVVDDLHPLLRSPRGAVRIAAARAILRLLRRYRPADVLPEPPRQPEPASEPSSQPVRPKMRTAGGRD